ncbi:MAG: TonB-dependent receptor [Burkholderiales bacterium]
MIRRYLSPTFVGLACGLLPWLAAAAAEDTSRERTAAPLPAVEVLGHYDNAVGTSNAASEGTVTARLLANRPVLRPAELLEFVPGLIATQHSGDGKANQYFLRGFNLDHGTDFATSVDAMPVNMPSHAHGQGYSDLNFLIPELVNRIDYRKGPYFARDGDFASAGSARIGLLNRLPRGLAQLTLGPNGDRRVLLADSSTAGTGTLLSALELQGKDGPWRTPEQLRKANGWLRWSQQDDSVQRSVTLMAYSARWNATDQIPERAVEAGTLGRFDAVDASDGGRTQRVSLSAQQRVSLDNGHWQASAYAISSRLNLWSNFTYFLDDPVNGDQFEQAERRKVVGGELSRQWRVTLAGLVHEVTLGTQLRHDRLSPVGLYTTAQRQRLSTTQESTVRQTQAGVYAEIGTRWTPWLRSVTGLRADMARFNVSSSVAGNSGTHADRLASPKLSIILGPWAESEFFVNWGQGFHSNDARGTVATVAPREGTAIDPVPGLSRSRGMELGARTESLPGLQSSLALWQLDLDSELVFVGDAGDTQASRASRRRGVEWSNHWRLGTLWPAARDWLLDADLAASRARFRQSAVEGDRVPGAVNHVASLGLTYDSKGPWFGQLQLRHFGPRDLTEDGAQRSRATTLTYLRGGWRLNPRMTLQLDVFNLFNQQSNDIEYVYASRLSGEATALTSRHFHPVEPRALRLSLIAQLR